MAGALRALPIFWNQLFWATLVTVMVGRHAPSPHHPRAVVRLKPRFTAGLCFSALDASSGVQRLLYRLAISFQNGDALVILG
jgi:hypothetical protein